MRLSKRMLGMVAFLAMAGCSRTEETNSIVVVTVVAPAGLPTVTQLKVVVINAGLSDTKMFPEAPVADGITFNTTFALTLPTFRSGPLGVAVAALDAGLQVVATGDAAVPIVVGGRADVTVYLGLVSNADAGLPGPEVPAADALGTVPPKTDGPIGLDARGTGGAGGSVVATPTGGSVGTGGTLGTGGTVVATPTGGTVGTGGAVGTGGRVGTGGIPFGTGGATSLGGGSGGSTIIFTGTGGVGTGGNTTPSSRGGSGGTTAPTSGALPSYTFPEGTEPCKPAKDVSGGQSGDFRTTGAFCFRTADDFTDYGCNTADERTLKINGTAVVKCGGKPPAKLGSFYYFDFGPGNYDYASVFWYCGAITGCAGAHPVPSCGHYPAWQSGATVAPCAD